MSILRKQAKSLEYKKAKDYDPEDDTHQSEDEEQSDSEEDAGATGREHYESVGKSKLRKPDESALDARYGGVAVSRKDLDAHDETEDDPFAAVDDEEEDDPFAAKNRDLSGSEEVSDPSDVENGEEVIEDDEIDSDEAFGESDVERFKNFTFRGSKLNRRGGGDEFSSASQESDEEDEDDNDLSEEDSDASDSDVDIDGNGDEGSIASSISSVPLKKPTSNRSSAREELRKAATSSSSTAALASALSAGAHADIKKGQAVKKQQQTFDRLLDARIKFQKGLTLASDIPNNTVLEEDVKAAAQQAEDAALALWSTIDSIRCTLLTAQQDASNTQSSGSDLKRKRPLKATRSTQTSDLWQHTTSLNSTILPIQRGTLDKWNTKTQPVIDTASKPKLLQAGTSTHSMRLTEVLDTYLATTGPTLIESSTSTSTSTSTSNFYDDNTFYQSLLRALISSRTNATSTSDLSESYLPPKLHASGSRAKKVDTKASKGRKVRYTVHEKLQDFMAVEDRGTWEDAARREFFASLLGGMSVLDEGVDGEDGDGDGDVEDGMEDVALRLFRN
ncbi:hypothetical protein LTR84_003847 [Exophiala bonariae]|uniref:Protein BFR2 n=1 Tax=Exophiala bonariae TaxID=1690606 RepID=A0AAV9N965_9EURO|nr:hypothetical protein LTR84_003847 [Exophiala bonariae]